MKNSLLIINFFIISTTIVYGQCDNNVSTDPNNPTNNALPDDESSGVPYDQDLRYLNGFDWWTPSSYTLDNMEFNPGQPYTTMSNIQSSGVLSYYSYLNKHSSTGIAPEEMNPENGWELLLINLGRYPDDSTTHSETDFQNVPYMVYYHRYKGTLRVFVRYGYNTFPNDAVDGVKINLYYDRLGNTNNLSGILRLGDGMDRTLDQPTNIEYQSTVVPPNGLANFWLSGDFQLAYDPCVCNYPTDLRLEFEYFSTTSLKLYGRGITTDEEIIDGNGSINNADFLSGVDFSSQQDAENGFIIYKNMAALADDYIAEMNAYQSQLTAVQQHNKEVEKNLVLIKVFRTAVSAGLIGLTGTSELADLALKAPSFFFDPTDPADSTKRTKFFKEVEKILGKKLDTYISDNFKKKSQPNQPTMPTASFSEMYFEGELFNELLINGPQFSTPGSFVNEGSSTLNVPENVYAYPIYNEALGQFALLERPKIKISYQDLSENCVIYDSDEVSFQNPPPSGPFVTEPVNYIHATNEKQIQLALDGDLKYTFNNTLPIAEHSVDVSFQVFSSVHEGIGTITEDFPFGEVDFYRWTYLKSNAFNNVNIESEAINVDANEYFYLQNNLLQTTDKKLTWNSIFTPVDAVNNMVYALGVTTEFVFPKDEIIPPSEWHDPSNFYQSYSYYNEWAASMFTSCYAWGEIGVVPRLREFNPRHIKVDSVYLKLLVNVTYDDVKDDSITPHEYTYAFSYKIDPSDIDYDYHDTPIYENLSGSILDVTQYPEDLILSGINFDGSQIEGCKLVGNSYTCQSWSTVTMDGIFSVGSGYDVHVKAGNEITVIPEAVLPPEMVLSIEPILDYSNPMPPADSTFIADFCKVTGAYNARTGTKILTSPLDSIEETTPSSPEKQSNFSFNLYPNPTGGQTTVALTLDEQSVVDLVVTDISGKILLSGLSNAQVGFGRSEYQLATETLATGIYLVHLSVNGERHVKRLIKN